MFESSFVIVSCCLQAINPELGGSASASLDAVVAKLARAKAGKGYASAREALLLNGRFVLGQVRGCCLVVCLFVWQVGRQLGLQCSCCSTALRAVAGAWL